MMDKGLRDISSANVIANTLFNCAMNHIVLGKPLVRYIDDVSIDQQVKRL